MALMKCPECGNDVSDKAKSCPHCGYPIEEFLIVQKEKTVIEKCPYCGSESIASEGYCNDCGMRIVDSPNKIINPNKVLCPKCGTENYKNNFYCTNCKSKLRISVNNEKMQETSIDRFKDEFPGIYTYDVFGKKKEVYCPRCGSSDCSHYQEQKIIPAKTKTRYTANLNPLRPFTLVNKREKVIKKEEIVTEGKFLCNKCGKIFN